MKIHIVNPNKTCFDFMEKLLACSFQDLGHDVVSRETADLVIWIQWGDVTYRQEHKEQKHVLLQVEDWLKRPGCAMIEYRPATGYDRVWGFDIENPFESYLPLGYHPRFQLRCEQPAIHEVGFLGGITQRRKDFNSSVKNKFRHISSWNYGYALIRCAQCRVNIHVHSYQPTNFTPWDRFSRFLHGGLFFITETCYCPMNTVKQFKFEEYDSVMDYFLSLPQSELNGMAVEMQAEYISKFDMRTLLEQKLKELSNV